MGNRKKIHISLIATTLLLIGCSSERRCARAAKRCAPLWKADTTYIHDSITIARESVDTVLSWHTLRERDTVTIRDGRAVIRIVRLPGDSVWVQGECGDTVIRYVRQVVTKTIPAPRKWWQTKFIDSYAVGWAFGLLMAVIVARLIRRL